MIFHHLRSSFKQGHLRRLPAPSFVHIVIGNDQLRKLGAVVIPLFDVVDSGSLHQHDSRLVIQTADKFVVIVGKKKLALIASAHPGDEYDLPL